MTGYNQAGLRQQIKQGNDFEAFFAQAPAIHPNSSQIKGVICGVRLEEIDDPLMQKIRYLDKLIDELAKGKAMGALLSADTLAGEISSGSIQTIVTKPLRRSDVVLGKRLGFAALLGLYSLLMSGGTVISILLQTGYLPHNILTGLSLIYLEALLVMTISLAGSSAMPALATGGMVFGLYGLAFIGGWIEQIGSLLNNPTAVKVGIVTSLIIPTEALWRRAAFDMQSPLSSALGMTLLSAVSVPSILMILYAILYLLIALVIAVSTFRHRDI